MQPPPTTYAPISQASQPITPSAGDYLARGADRINQLYTGAENLISGAPGASEAFKQAAGFTPTTLGTGILAGEVS